MEKSYIAIGLASIALILGIVGLFPSKPDNQEAYLKAVVELARPQQPLIINPPQQTIRANSDDYIESPWNNSEKCCTPPDFTSEKPI